MLDKIGSVLMLRKSMVEGEDEVLWPHRLKTALKKTDTGEGRRQAAKGKICKILVPGFKRLHEAGHGRCIPSGD